ncbi:MAG: FG-GAP repeat domain-containing protein [Planctomycetota bacterium]
MSHRISRSPRSASLSLSPSVPRPRSPWLAAPLIAAACGGGGGGADAVLQPVGVPVVAGMARLLDVDRDGTLSAGDQLVVPFSTDVQVDGATAADFVLPVTGDSLGTGAAVSAGPSASEVTIALGTGARLRTRGAFATGALDGNSPSGIDVLATAAIRNATTGAGAAASTPLDAAPTPVDVAAVFTGADHVASGDADFDPDQHLDLFVHDGNDLVSLAGDGAFGFGEVDRVPTGPVVAMITVDLNHFTRDEVVTAAGSTVQVFNNTSALQAGATLTAPGVRALVAVDLNDDGFPDLVAGGANELRVFEHQRNLGNSFAPGQQLPLGAQVTALAAGDFDGDGATDLVAALANQQLRVLRNEDGTLVPLAVVDDAQLDGAAALDVADFDRDGRLDAAVATATGVLLLRQTAAFAFALIPVAAPAPGVAADDRDGDGFADLLVRRADGVEVLQNDRAGGFTAVAMLELADLRGLALGDFDADGDRDLATAAQAVTRVLAASRAGSFGDVTLAPAATLGTAGTGGQAFGDVDGDGRADRVAAGGDGVEVWLGQADGEFVLTATLGTPARAVALGDLDRDGDLDLVAAFTVSTQVLLNDGSGAFTQGQTFAGIDSLALALLDLDSDFDLDVVVGRDGANLAFENQLAGGVIALVDVSATTFATSAGTERTFALLAVDFDGEGDPDLVVVNGDDGLAQPTLVLRNSGGVMTEFRTLSSGEPARSVAYGDLDGDGFADLLIGRQSALGNSTVQRYAGLRTAIDTLGRNVHDTALPTDATALAIGDLDGDGRADLLVAAAGQALLELRQLADGTFTQLEHVDTGLDSVRVVDALDLDADGDLDVVTGGVSSDRVLRAR